ncbi:hypothetical protein [Ignavibacterium sp.]|uniref:hypothetical protein n=1 Tax=Ignavibacterium sp. TaxID=2651167 RepID=UPI00307D9EC8
MLRFTAVAAIVLFAVTTFAQVEQAVRYRVDQNVQITQQQNSTNGMVEKADKMVLQNKSNSQLEELGGRFGWVRSNSQLEELGGRFGWVRSNSQLEELGGRWGWVR